MLFTKQIEDDVTAPRSHSGLEMEMHQKKCKREVLFYINLVRMFAWADLRDQSLH